MGILDVLGLFNFLIAIIFCVPSDSFEMKVEYSWKQFDFQFPNETLRQEQLKSRAFIPENVIVMSTAVWKNRLFLVLPRNQTEGIPATLAYINLDGPSGNKSPKLIPYPNWETNQIERNGFRLLSVYNIEVDVCDRLWMHDNGWINQGIYGLQRHDPRILVYDLKTDKLIDEYVLKLWSAPSNIVVDVTKDNCDKAFAYSPKYADGILVYDFANKNSWSWGSRKIDFDHLGIALSGVNHHGYRAVYFHRPTSNQEFSVSTRVLQDRTAADKATLRYELKSGRSFAFDEKTGVLLYAEQNFEHSIFCWNTIKHADSVTTIGMITVGNSADENITIALPNLKVDQNGNLWVVILYDLVPLRQKDQAYNEGKVVISTVPVRELIKGTVCDVD